MFNDKEVLSVIESAEPNNILWENLENSFTERSSIPSLSSHFPSSSSFSFSFLLIHSHSFSFLFSRSLRFIGAWLLSLLTMAASFFLIQRTYGTHPSLVPIVIGLIDSVLPTIFLNITIFECHIDEDDKQNSLMVSSLPPSFLSPTASLGLASLPFPQFKLYGAKLLSSVFFTYANTKVRFIPLPDLPLSLISSLLCSALLSVGCLP
jgi:hypothetical protein